MNKHYNIVWLLHLDSFCILSGFTITGTNTYWMFLYRYLCVREKERKSISEHIWGQSVNGRVIWLQCAYVDTCNPLVRISLILSCLVNIDKGGRLCRSAAMTQKGGMKKEVVELDLYLEESEAEVVLEEYGA